MSLSFWFLALLFALLLFVLLQRQRNRRLPIGVPLSEPRIPLLGNALAFESDAANFVRSNARRLGKVFGLNLAGFQLTLLSDESALKKYYRCGESVLSSYDALHEVGFDVALGEFNLFHAPQMHRKLLRELSESQFVARFDAAFSRFLAQATESGGEPVDFLPLVRYWFFIAFVAGLLGPEFLADFDVERFAEQFLAWQDRNEDATARSFVAPAFARSWIMSPIARGRVQLRDWIEPFVARRRRAARNAVERDFVDCLLDARPDDSAAELADCVVGLLTAGPKNVSISFANMLMLLHDDSVSAAQRARFRHEALHEYTNASSFVLRCWSATLRMTNLVIGSLRVAKEAVEFETERGAKFTLLPGQLVGASHLLRSCANEQTFSELLLDDNVETHAFSHGGHACPGARLAERMVVAAARAWCQIGVEFGSADRTAVASPPPQPELCFRKATLAQRRAPWMVRLRRIEKDNNN
jgi:cytochrome P450